VDRLNKPVCEARALPVNDVDRLSSKKSIAWPPTELSALTEAPSKPPMI
jgi:hypothetical protein